MKRFVVGFGIWSIFLIPALSQTLQSNQIFASEDFIFFESSLHPEHVFYIFKTWFEILNETRGALGNTGLMGRCKLIKSGWLIQGERIDQKIEAAKIAVPEWRDFNFSKLPYISRGCSLYDEIDDVRIISGERSL